MTNESAIIVPVVEAEPLVAPLRRQYDPSAALGVPAHITLLYPFLPLNIAEAEIENLSGLFRNVNAFTFTLVAVRRFPRTAYLHPHQPERFTDIVTKLLKEWPECLPYRGAFDVVPHLTVADQVDASALDIVQRSLEDRLPISCTAKEAWLLFSDDAGFWHRRERLPFT